MGDIEFFVPEFEYREKSREWYLWVLFLGLLFILGAMLTNNPTFIVIIMMGGTLLVLRGNAKPKLVPFAIHDKGIYLKNKFWDFKDIKDFSIYEIDDDKYFIFTPKGSLQTPIKIKVPETESIKQKLNNLALQVEYQESLIEALVRVMGF